MTTAPSPRLMTAEELLALPDDGKQYELVQGELVEVSPSAIVPTIVALNLAARIWNYLRRRKIGICGIADGGFVLQRGPDTVRAPDVWFVRSERIPEAGLPASFWPGTPDLAVEVLSPTDRFAAVLRKAQDYIAAGTLLVWVIDPAGTSAAVFAPGQPALLLGEHGTLDGGDLLPGFTLRLRDVLV